MFGVALIGRGKRGDENLVTNGTFDFGITGWVASGAGVISWDSTGQRIIFSPVNDGATGGGVYELLLVVGETYRVRGRIKRKGTTGDFSLNIVNAAGTAFVYKGADRTDANEYLEDFTFVATETDNKIYLRSSLGNPIPEIYADDISVYLV